MSFDQLMQHAVDIEKSAAYAEYRQYCNLSPRVPPIVGYEELQAKYHNRVQPLFEPFTRIPDPHSYDGMIDDLYGAMEHLAYGSHHTDPITGQAISANRDLRAIESAADELGDWTGAAAMAFKTNFLDPFPAVATNQFLILGIMKGAAEADRAVWQNARKNIDGIAHTTLHALDNLGSCGKNDFEFALSVAAAVVAVAGIPFTAGASAVVAGVGAALAVTGAAAKGAERVQGSGGSAEQIVHSMETAVHELTGQIRDTEGQITRTLHGYAAEVAQHNEPPSSFVSARPKLATMEGSELISSKGLGASD